MPGSSGDGLADPTKLRAQFAAIESAIFGYPAVDQAAFRARLEATLSPRLP